MFKKNVCIPSSSENYQFQTLCIIYKFIQNVSHAHYMKFILYFMFFRKYDKNVFKDLLVELSAKYFR